MAPVTAMSAAMYGKKKANAFGRENTCKSTAQRLVERKMWKTSRPPVGKRAIAAVVMHMFDARFGPRLVRI
jgi:hypothetical protein